MQNIVYLNGKYLPIEEAKISVMDRGFLLGDGVYETITVYNNQLFRVEQHLNRLRHSLQGIGLDVPKTDKELISIFNKLIKQNPSSNLMQTIYLQITRGETAIRRHTFEEKVTPTIFIKISPVKNIQQDNGATAITVEDIRWRCCDIKAINRLANVLMSQQAYKAGAEEAIIIDDAYVIEGASSNVFIVKKNIVITPPPSEHILFGVTRYLVLDIANKNNIKVQEKNITVTELLNADEVWITSSGREILPIIKVNDTIIGSGKPGPIFQTMIKLYHEYIRTL